MKNRYRFLALIILTFSAFSLLFALETPVRGEVEFSIRFYDRRIYYVESDPIYVQITIANNSPNPYRFKLADDRAFSIDFDIRTMSNRELPQADSLIRKRTQYQQVFFREIAIESGESFSFVEDIRDYVSFSQAGSYRVRAKVYPELNRATNVAALESNYLSLSLRPSAIRGPGGIPLEMDVDTGAVLVRQRLAPDEVVSYMLTARQQSQWERFFLYLDLESMLLRDAVQRRRYLAENELGRRRMITDYRQSLQTAILDGDISMIPTTFEIQRTVYDNYEGEVTALLRFRNPTFTELRRYTYFLEKKDDYWVIVNYSVQGLGTEIN
jgi:hypothetical protein